MNNLNLHLCWVYFNIMSKRIINVRIYLYISLIQNGEDGEPLVATFPNGKPFGPQYEQEHEIEIIRDIGHGRYGQVRFTLIQVIVLSVMLLNYKSCY